MIVHVQSCLHVQLILHWTDVDRVGQKFVFVCNVLDTECKSEHCLEN